MVKIGNNLIAQSKMQYYPTQKIETLKMLKYIVYMDINHYKKQTLEKQVLGEQLYKEIFTQVLDGKYISFVYAFYDWCLDNNRYDLINEYIECRAFNTEQENKEFIVADLFAGEAKWLESIKTFLKYTNKPKLKLIANELEENRYNTIKENGIVDEIYLGSFEALKLPKKSISLMLFNPPYNDDLKQRNCKKYLQMILDRELIYKNNDQYHRETGSIIMVIREDDFLDSLDVIVKNFNIDIAYKVNTDEFQKWKQWVIIANLRYIHLEDTRSYDVLTIQEQINKFKDIIYKGETYSYHYNILLYPLDYQQLKENFKYIINKSSNIKLSENDNVLKWIKDVTELKDMSVETLTIPKPLKQGEIANLISSGYINSEMSLQDGTAKHIVIGGTKNMVKTEKHIEKGDDGEKYEVTEEVRYTQPYLNILCNKDNKMQILELAGEKE